MATAPRPLVVLAGAIHPDGRALLEKEARVVVCEDETEAGLIKAAAEAQGILFRIRPPCTESLMGACQKLKVIGRHGVGLDTVDIPAATRLGVAVVHAPGSNSQAVAEHALMLMLVAVKRTLVIDKQMRGGDWSAGRGGNTELAGKTLRIVGVGNIGRRRGKLAAAGLDVWEEEPTSRDNPILNLESVVCSPHMAGVTREANRQMAMQVSGEMLRVLRGERPEVLVNPDVWPRLGQR